MPLRFAALVAVSVLLVAACASDAVVGHHAARPADSTVAPPATAAPTTTAAVSTTVTTTTRQPVVSAGLGLVRPGGAEVFSAPGAAADYVIHEGVLLGFDTRDGEYLEVVTTCDDTVWVLADDVAISPKARGAGPAGSADLAAATVVIDPGHGSRDWGGVGPTGLSEKEVNLDISVRLRDLLESSHDVDWETGAVTSGSSVPAAAGVWLTRDPDGPEAGDYELGLTYRSHIANTAGADAFVSIHNNTVPTADPDQPGSEVFYAFSVDGSDRLASLIHQELLRSLAPFGADWKGGLILGARSRIDPETDTDYYGILRRANMPAVIVEGVYISEPEEEALLRTDVFRRAYAEAVYRGIVRFLTTPDFGEEVNDPELFTSDAGTVNTSACVVPQQP